MCGVAIKRSWLTSGFAGSGVSCWKDVEPVRADDAVDAGCASAVRMRPHRGHVHPERLEPPRDRGADRAEADQHHRAAEHRADGRP
jgi:hypothetical protein